MAYLVLARKWRPQNFEEMVGQDPITRTLQNAMAQGRVAHAYLFTGARGVGKTSMARILAKALNCEQGAHGPPLQPVRRLPGDHPGSAMDVLEIDGASNRGIDEIRDLRENVKLRPAQGQYQDLHHRRSPHAHQGGLQRPAEDPGRAAAARDLHLRHHRAPQGPGDHPLAAASGSTSAASPPP